MSNIIYGTVGIVAGVILLLTEDYIWGVIGCVAGAYFWFRWYQDRKAKKGGPQA